jgi:hypothetical protein
MFVVGTWKSRQAAARGRRELATQVTQASAASPHSVYEAGVARRFCYREVPEQALARGPIYLITIMGHRELVAQSATIARLRHDDQNWYGQSEIYPPSSVRWDDAMDSSTLGSLEARLGGRQHWGVVCSDIQSVVLFLELARWDVVEFFVEPLVVVEADPGERLMLDVFEAGESATVDELALKRRDPRLGHRVDAPMVKYSSR